MQDLKEYHDNLIMDENGDIRKIHYCNDFIFTDREITEDIVKQRVKNICKRFGIVYRGLVETYLPGHRMWASDLAHQELAKEDIKDENESKN
jgi:hypothetical protein